MNIKTVADAAREFGLSSNGLHQLLKRNRWPRMMISRTLYVDVDVIREKLDSYIPPVSVKEVSEATGLSADNIRGMCRRGELTARLINGHAWRFESLEKAKGEIREMMEAYTDENSGTAGPAEGSQRAGRQR